MYFRALDIRIIINYAIEVMAVMLFIKIIKIFFSKFTQSIKKKNLIIYLCFYEKFPG